MSVRCRTRFFWRVRNKVIAGATVATFWASASPALNAGFREVCQSAVCREPRCVLVAQQTGRFLSLAIGSSLASHLAVFALSPSRATQPNVTDCSRRLWRRHLAPHAPWPTGCAAVQAARRHAAGRLRPNARQIVPRLRGCAGSSHQPRPSSPRNSDGDRRLPCLKPSWFLDASARCAGADQQGGQPGRRSSVAPNGP